MYSVMIPLDVIVMVEREGRAAGALSDSKHVVVYSEITPLDVKVTVETVVCEVADDIEETLP